MPSLPLPSVPRRQLLKKPALCSLARMQATMHPCDTRGGKDGAATSGATTVQQQAPQLPEAAEKPSVLRPCPTYPRYYILGLVSSATAWSNRLTAATSPMTHCPEGPDPPFQLVAAISSQADNRSIDDIGSCSVHSSSLASPTSIRQMTPDGS